MNRLKRNVKDLLLREDGQTTPSFGFAFTVFTSAAATVLTGRSGSVATALHSVAGLLP